MASQSSPSTPASQKIVPPPAPTPPTGSWRHPRMEEIRKRQEAITLNGSRLWKLTHSVLVIILLWAIKRNVLPWLGLNESTSDWASFAIHLTQLWLATNIALTIYPLLTKHDDLSDIPLTPRQRALLGLGPSSGPATPGSDYVTPPRYPRSLTPSSGSSRVAVAGSPPPLSRSTSGSPMNGSPLNGRGGGWSPFSSSFSTPGGSGSPLIRKAVGGKRWSLGGGEMQAGLDESARASLTGTPSPSGGQRGVSVSLNNKWLYQRQKGSPGGRSVYI